MPGFLTVAEIREEEFASDSRIDLKSLDVTREPDFLSDAAIHIATVQD